MSPTLRRAAAADAPAIAALFTRVRRTALPFLPALHTPEEDREFFAAVVLPSRTVWLAAGDAGIAGFIAWKDDEVDHLYVDAGSQGRGIGTGLLALPMTERRRLELWTFEKNAGARAFYARRGFRELYRTDGSGNEEREPDVRLAWERPA